MNKDIDIYNIPIEYNKEQYINILKGYVTKVWEKEKNKILEPEKWKEEAINIIEKLNGLITNYYYLKKCAEN